MKPELARTSPEWIQRSRSKLPPGEFAFTEGLPSTCGRRLELRGRPTCHDFGVPQLHVCLQRRGREKRSAVMTFLVVLTVKLSSAICFVTTTRPCFGFTVRVATAGISCFSGSDREGYMWSHGCLCLYDVTIYRLRFPFLAVFALPSNSSHSVEQDMPHR